MRGARDGRRDVTVQTSHIKKDLKERLWRRPATWPIATIVIFLICSWLFAAQMLAGLRWDGWLLSPLYPTWQTLISYAFFHADALHWTVNMAFLVIVGTRVERATGTLMTSGVFLLGGVVAGLLHLSMVYLFLPLGTNQPLIGSSGGIAALLGTYTVRYYDHRIMPLPIPVGWALGLWFVGEGLIGWFSIRQGNINVAHWAHIGGFLAGLSLAVLAGIQQAARREAAMDAPSPDQKARKLAEYLAAQPDDAESRLVYARSLLALGERERAARAFSRAVDTWIINGRPREAADAYMAMCVEGLSPTTPSIETGAARAMEECGLKNEALKVYDKVVSGGGPQAESAALRAARLVENENRYEEAVRRYRDFLARFPHSQWCGLARRRLARLEAERA